MTTAAQVRTPPLRTGDPSLSVVVPCYDEQEGIDELFRRLTSVCRARGQDFEIVLVNDGSRDLTWQKIVRISESNNYVVAVNLSRNHGHQLALSAGLSVCRGDRILIIDADLQDPPELLAEMELLMDEGADIVYGQRRHRAGETWFKKFTASLFYRLLERLTDVSIPRDTGDFRLMSRRALNVLLSMEERHRFIRGMVSWIGFKQVPILYDRDARFAGETKYPLKRMVRLAIDAVTSFSTRPLRIATELSVLTILIAAGLLAFSLISWLLGGTLHGWTSILTVICMFGSVQLAILGIFGEYLGRLYEEAKDRPLFIIETVLRQESVQGPSNGELTTTTHK